MFDEPPADAVNLGHNHYYTYTCWKPDRDLNPQYKDIPDIEKLGLIIYHKHSVLGCNCMGCIYFDTPDIRKVFDPGHLWQVESWEPLTLSPSLLCKMIIDGKKCGDHGFIRNGVWQPC